MTDEITLDAPGTRLERFLAAAAGVDGITLDEPVTRIEKYLYKIAQGGGSGGGGSGGVLVVTDTNGTLDKTWQEIHDAMLSGGAVISADNPTRAITVAKCVHDTKSGEYQCIFGDVLYVASSADGYPSLA